MNLTLSIIKNDCTTATYLRLLSTKSHHEISDERMWLNLSYFVIPIICKPQNKMATKKAKILKWYLCKQICNEKYIYLFSQVKFVTIIKVSPYWK